MALVTVQRSPCGSNSPGPTTEEIDGTSDTRDGEEESPEKKGISECYFAVKGAALVLPHDECLHIHRKSIANGACDIQQHLQSMLYLLHAEDILKMAVKLESIHSTRTRYLVVVNHPGGKYQTEESCLLGIDCNKETTIGLLLPVWADTRITLDGDGGFSITSSGRHHIFKPVSVQAMWSALQTLHKCSSKARDYNHFKCGGTHQWVEYYEKRINSDRSCLNEWHAMDDIQSRRPPSPDTIRVQPTEREETERHIRTKLKEIMMSVDLDEVTSKYIRTRLEEILDMNLKEYKSFIDQEMLTILGQMDSPTEIFQYLYLGSEWNASNLEELVVNGIGHILNVTREIDNFFPGMFDYQNIRVYDDESTEILHYWDKTYRYIRRAKDEGSKVLVHCKMGISRSASVVIAYVMKAYDWDLQRALDFVKTKRNCIKPNSGFLKQLEIYQGILDASKQRHNSLWRSKSETNLESSTKPKKKNEDKKEKVPEKSESLHHLIIGHNSSSRPKSWSPSYAVADLLFPSQNVSNTEELSCGQNFNLCETSNQNSNTSSSSDTVQSRTLKNVDNSTLSCNSQIPRVSSIKDRINELELQVTSSPEKPAKSEVKSPTSQSRSGLVFNLANQFESGSKPSSPVDEGLIMKSPSLEESMVQPIVSQMKPPVCKHHAVLVKPSVWPEDSRSVPETTPTNDSGLSQIIHKTSSKVSFLPCISSKSESSCDTFVQKTADDISFKTSHVATASKPPSVPAQGLVDKKASLFPQSFPFNPINYTSTSDKRILENIPFTAPVERNVKDTGKVSEPVPIIKKPFKSHDNFLSSFSPCLSRLSSASCTHSCNAFYNKEDIPFTPGRVLRTKQKIEEKNLTRTMSFDSGFLYKTHSTPSSPPDCDGSPGKLIRRSHSLRNDCRPTMPFYGKWYPLPALTSNPPFSRKNTDPLSPNSVNLSVSTPSVVEAVNRVICGTQEVLSSAIPFLPPKRKSSSRNSSSDSDFDFGSANSLSELEPKELARQGKSPLVQRRENPVPGLVKLQKEILENKAGKSLPDKFSGGEGSKTKKDPSKLHTQEHALNPLVISDELRCDDIKDSGIVKRLKKELEAKSGSDSSSKKDKTLGAGLSEIEDLEKCISKSAQNMSTSLHSEPAMSRTPSSSSVKKKTEEIKAPPTPHRKTSLDLSIIQKRFPLTIKLGSTPTPPVIKPNIRTNFFTDTKIPPTRPAAPSTTASISAKPSSGCSADIPPTGLPRKLRKQHGSTHPLSKLINRHSNPLYNTM